LGEGGCFSIISTGLVRKNLFSAGGFCDTLGGMAKTYYILGCTGCGKGAVGRALAKRIGGQVLSVDSMKVYRRMDIGTAKPSAEAQADVRHHGLDLVEPSEAFSVAQYVQHARQAIAAIRAAGAIPLAVGGTSLYIKAMTEGLFEGPPVEAELRQALRERAGREGSRTLHAELARVDPPAAAKIHPNDEKRILRALEVYRQTGRPITEMQTQWREEGGRADPDAVLVGLRRDKADQSGRINRRVKRMVEMGLREEVEALLAEPAGLSDQAAQAVGYAELIEYFQGTIDFEKAIETVKINTRRLAKKQRTWHRRWPGVHWVDLTAEEPVERTVERLLGEIDFA
jgi:tRNA dimethylallyltransferase